MPLQIKAGKLLWRKAGNFFAIHSTYQNDKKSLRRVFAQRSDSEIFSCWRSRFFREKSERCIYITKCFLARRQQQDTKGEVIGGERFINRLYRTAWSSMRRVNLRIARDNLFLHETQIFFYYKMTKAAFDWPRKVTSTASSRFPPRQWTFCYESELQYSTEMFTTARVFCEGSRLSCSLPFWIELDIQIRDFVMENCSSIDQREGKVYEISCFESWRKLQWENFSFEFFIFFSFFSFHFQNYFEIF